MTGWRFAVAVAVEVALVVVIAGVVVRGRWRLSRFFATYLVAVLTGNVLITWWPQRFFDFDFWMAKEVVYSFLKIGIVAEVAWLTCRPFPGSAILTRRRLLLLLVVTTIAVLMSPPPWEEARRAWGGYVLTTIGQYHARAQVGLVYMTALIFVTAYWYRLPLHPFHVAVLTPLALYIGLFGVLLHLYALNGWWAHVYFNALDPPTYLGLTLWWAWAAWRPEPAATAVHEALVKRIEVRSWA